MSTGYRLYRMEYWIMTPQYLMLGTYQILGFLIQYSGKQMFDT